MIDDVIRVVVCIGNHNNIGNYGTGKLINGEKYELIHYLYDIEMYSIYKFGEYISYNGVGLFPKKYNLPMCWIKKEEFAKYFITIEEYRNNKIESILW